MGIRFLCTACGKKINVKDFLAGKRGLCPRCGAGVDIPLVSQLPPSKKRLSHDKAGKSRSTPTRAAADVVEGAAADRRGLRVGRLLGMSELPTVDPLAESPQRRWIVSRWNEAEPLDAATVRNMLTSGNISADAIVRREDWSDGLPAGVVFREVRCVEAPIVPLAGFSPPPSPLDRPREGPRQ